MTLTGDTGFNFARGSWRIPRSRGALTGLLLMALGAWGALIPFIGPAFNFGFGGTQSWTWTAARFWLEVLPGIATFVGGLMLLVSANRGTAMFGAWLAIAAGIWFVIGPTLAPSWHLGDLGTPMGSTGRQAVTWLVFFYGLGALITALAANAHGRISVRSLRDIENAQAFAQRRILRKEAHGGVLGGLRGGGARKGKAEPVHAGRDERADWSERDAYGDRGGRTEHRESAGAPSGHGGWLHRGDRKERAARDERPPERDVYPSDAERASRGERGERAEPTARREQPTGTPRTDERAQRVDRAERVDRAGGPDVYPSDRAGGPDVYPSDTTQTDEAARGRHEAPHEGFAEKIGHTLARHGIGGKH